MFPEDNPTCKDGEEEPAWGPCGWTEDCRWAEGEVTFQIFHGSTHFNKWLKFVRCLQQTHHSPLHRRYYCNSPRILAHFTDGETEAESASE